MNSDALAAMDESTAPTVHILVNPANDDSVNKRKRLVDDGPEVTVKHERLESPLFVAESDDDEMIDLDPEEDPFEPGESQWAEGQEEYPDLAAYKPAFEEIKKTLPECFPEIKTVFDANPSQTEAVKSILDKIPELERVPETPPIRVALLGDAGAGKSSTTNSLLDIPLLAKESGAGRSCTYVVTEYRRPFPDQNKKFGANLRYANANEIRSTLRQLLNDYDIYEFNFDPTWDQDTKEERKLLHETALSTFLALFCNTEEFSSSESAKTFLETRNVLDTFVEWSVAHLQLKHLTDEGFSEYFEADTVKDFRDKLDPLVSASALSGLPALWPLVKQVSIGVDGPRVLKNITLADLPGITDTNQMRVNATLDYLRTCDALWLVAKGDRVLTDRNIDLWLQRYAERFRGNIAIIVTRSDEMNITQVAGDMKALGYDMQEYNNMTAQWKEVRNQITSANSKLRNVQRRKKPDAQEKLRLQDLRDELQARKDSLNDKRLDCVVKIKNQDITINLQRGKQDRMPESKILSVHCIGNSAYAQLKGCAPTDGAKMSAEGTGVPALRAYALRVPAAAMLRTLEEYFNHNFMAFITGLELWAGRASVKGRKSMMSIVEEPQKHVDEFLNAYSAALKLKVESNIKGAFAEHQEELIERSRMIVQRFRQDWKFNSFRAFTLRAGKHKTTVQESQSWNEKFLELAEMQCGPTWDEMALHQEQLLKDFSEALIGLARRILVRLRDEPDAIALPTEKLGDLIEAQCEGIRAAFATYGRAYDKQDANIKLDTFKDQEKSFFREAMSVGYTALAQLGGKGYYDNAILELTNHVTQRGTRSPFALTAKEATTAVDKNGRDNDKILKGAVVKIFKELHTQFGSMIEDQNNRNPAEHPARAAMRQYLSVKKPQIEAIKAGLAALKSNTHG